VGLKTEAPKPWRDFIHSPSDPGKAGKQIEGAL